MGGGLEQLVHHLRRLAAPSEGALDSVLLERFVQSRDEEAFTALVARHGPMVLRVCQRVLADRGSAEDSFQATFLVLARKATSIRRPESIASWLHDVALRVAAKARQAEKSRYFDPLPGNASKLIDSYPDPLAQLTVRELLQALDQEVQRLPRVYRLPIVLCCLENVSQEEAARRLGWAPGSVKARLERGRKRLQSRLTQRGFTAPAVLAALTLAGGAAALGPGLRAATVKAAVLFGAGRVGPAAGSVVVLAEAALKGLTACKLKVLAWAVVVALGFAGAVESACEELKISRPAAAVTRKSA